MIRQIIQLLAIFILPFLFYFAYVLVMRARAKAGDDKPSWEDGPWFWLAITGLALCVVAFVGVGLLRETSTDLHNVPK